MRLSAPIYQLKRQARLLARKDKIPLYSALNRIAQEEGFVAWSRLAACVEKGEADKHTLLEDLESGDMLLIAALPGQGKTMLGLKLLLEAAQEGRRSAFFTLEYSEQEAKRRLRSIHGEEPADGPEIVTSDDISADFIIRHLADAKSGTVAVIDYLQILDQQRSKPPLFQQMEALGAFARRTGVILGFVSQIDRAFDPVTASMPGLSNIRLPNHIPEDTFTKAYFLNEGETRLLRTA